MGLVLAIGLGLSPRSGWAQGTAPTRGDPLVRRLYVPANQPDEWPTGPWEPWSRARVDEALRAVRRVQGWQATAPLAEARYEATLLGDTLTEGRLHWTFEDRDPEPRFVELDPCHLVLQRLEWQSRPELAGATFQPGLAWGRTANGRLGFCSPGWIRDEQAEPNLVRRLISGDWSLDGDRWGRALVFHLVLPRAQVSRLRLQVPQGLQVTTSVGFCRGPRDEGPPGWAAWEIELGQHHECRLRIAPGSVPHDATPRLTARPDISFTVRPESTRVRAVFEFASWEGEVDSVQVAVPHEMRIASVLYGDLPTSWSAGPAAEGRVLIALPEKVRGPLRRIELRGLLPGSLNQAWQMPHLGTPDALELEGHLGVRMQGAQPVSSLRYGGLRQFGYDPSPQDGEVFEFRRLRADATLELNPVQESRRLAVRSFSIVEAGPAWQAECQLQWTLGEGSAWSVDCEVSSDWEVLDVRHGQGSDEDRPLDWSLEPQGERQRITAELTEALDNEHPLTLKITLRGAGPAPGQETRLPPVRPLGVPTGEQIVVLQGIPSSEIDCDAGNLPNAVQWSEVPALLPDPWRNLPSLVERERRLQEEVPVWLMVIPGDARARIQRHSGAPSGPIQPTPTERTANAASAPERTPSLWIAEALARVRLGMSGEESDEYELTWTIPTPTGTRELHWEFPEEAESPWVTVDGGMGIPLNGKRNFREGVVLPASHGPARLQQIVIRYRCPGSFEGGLQQRELELVVPEIPVIKTRLEVRLPAPLLLTTPPSHFISAEVPAPSTWGAWWRGAQEPRFNPWLARDWIQLLEGSNLSPEEASGDGYLWRGETAGTPRRVRLTTWSRNEARSLGWWSCLASLVLGLIIRQRWPRRMGISMALLLGLLGLAALLASPLTWSLLQCAGGGLLLSLLVPEAWLAGSGSKLARPSGWTTANEGTPGRLLTRASGAGLVIWFCWTAVAHSQSEGLPRALLGPLETLGDILIPTDDSGEAVDDTLYVSPEFKGNVAEPMRQIVLPHWLCRETSVETVSGGPRGELLEVRLKGVRLGTDSLEIPLQFSSLTLADEVACLVNGHPHDVWRVDGTGGMMLALGAGEHLGGSVGGEPRPPQVALPDDTSTAWPVAPSSSLDLVTELEIVLRLLPVPDETVRRARRVTLPATAATRLRFPSDANLGRWRFAQSAARFHPPPRVGLPEEWGVQVQELQWEPGAAEATPRIDSIRVESWALVEFDGEVNTLRCWARYAPGGSAVDAVRWIIPAGMTVRQVQAPALAGESWERLEGDDRRLSLEFVESQSQSFEVVLDLIQSPGKNPLELRFPDPADNNQSGRPRFDLRQFRAALRSPIDRQLVVSSPMIDQPLRSIPATELAREVRFGEVTPDLAFELDRPLSLMILLQPGGRELEAATVEQRGIVQAGRLDWRYVVTGVRSGQSVFHYELAIDSRLEVADVTVREQQTDRAARWSRDGDRLTIFLGSRASTAQTIEVTGSLPLPETGEILPPRVRLQGFQPAIERRLLTASDRALNVRLASGDAPSTGPDGTVLLFDAPTDPAQEWPALRLSGTTNSPPPDRPEPPTPPADDDPDRPVATPGPTATPPVSVRHAEVEVLVTHRTAETCTVRLWIGPGEAGTLSWQIPPGVQCLAMQWNGSPLAWEPVGRTGDEAAVISPLPDRDEEGLLESIWQLPVAAANPPSRFAWVRPLPAIPRVKGAAVERLVVLWSSAADDWLSMAPPWRGVPAPLLREWRRERAPSPDNDWSSTPRLAVGSVRAIEEWQQSGLLTGLTPLSGDVLRAGQIALLSLGIAVATWLLAPVWRALQSRWSLTLAALGLIWWGWFLGGGWGFVLALLTLPAALLDLWRGSISRNPSAAVRR